MRKVPTLAEAARRRLEARSFALDSPEAGDAKVAFFNAVVDQDYRKAHEAFAVFGGFTAHRLSPAERARMQPRVNALVKWVHALRELRLQERSGVARPPPTPAQAQESRAIVDRFGRWLAGDDSAGPFE